MKRGIGWVSLLAVFFVLAGVPAVFAAPGDIFLAKMKVTRAVVTGTTSMAYIEYEVQDAVRGPALLKKPPYILEVGEALNMFVQEGIAQNGRPVYAGLGGILSRSFKEGFAPVRIGNQWNFMNKKGKLLSAQSFKEVDYFNDGFAACLLDSDGRCVYLNRKGKVLKTPKLFAAFDELPFNSGFAEGYSLMNAELEDGSEAVILINKKGKVKAVREDGINTGGKFSGGLAPVEIGPNIWGYLNTRGELAIFPGFLKARSFHEGLAAVYIKNRKGGGKWGFIDKNGDFVVAAIYDYAGDFSEGMARVRAGDRNGFIDKSGKVIVNLTFDEARSFSDGFAAVRRGEFWGYINKKGEVAVDCVFAEAGDFVGGLAPAKSNEGFRYARWGYIDKTGKFAIQPKYGSAAAFSEGLARVVEYDQKKQWGGNAMIKYINTSEKVVLWFLVPL